MRVEQHLVGLHGVRYHHEGNKDAIHANGSFAVTLFVAEFRRQKARTPGFQFPSSPGVGWGRRNAGTLGFWGGESPNLARSPENSTALLEVP